MKSLLEFKENAFVVEEPKKEWNDFYLELIDKFKEWELEDRVDSFNYKWEGTGRSFNKNFERSFITKLIIHVLDLNQESPLWRDIFEIMKTQNNQVSYHGSMSDVIIETYTFSLEDKQDVLSRVSGKWIYENYDQVKEFMDQYNDKYIKLFEIKRLFPITISEEL